MSLRIAIVGYGKMGRSIERLAGEHNCEVACVFRSAENVNAVGLNHDSLSGADVAIEFTTPQTALQNLLRLIELGIPVVTGTTGWFAELPRIRELCESKNGGVVCGPTPPDLPAGDGAPASTGQPLPAASPLAPAGESSQTIQRPARP